MVGPGCKNNSFELFYIVFTHIRYYHCSGSTVAIDLCTYHIMGWNNFVLELYWNVGYVQIYNNDDYVYRIELYGLNNTND